MAQLNIFGSSFKRFLGKAIVVILWLHLLNHRLHIAFQLSRFLIVTHHGTHILLREPQHAVEKWIRADIPADIEAAGQIVQGNRADTRHENTVEHALVILEGIPIETAGMRDNMIDLVVLFIQDHIRKVVILVYDKVKGIAQAAGFGIQHVQLVKSLSGKTEPTMNSSL